MNALKRHWFGIRREYEREEGRSKLGKGQFCNKQENAAGHGVNLKD
jgi:hypothetical protein